MRLVSAPELHDVLHLWHQFPFNPHNVHDTVSYTDAVSHYPVKVAVRRAKLGCDGNRETWQ